MDLPTLHLGTVQQIQEKCLVAGAVLDHHDTLTQCSLETGKGFFAGLTVGDDLGDQGVEVGRDRVALRHARVHAHARTGKHSEALDASGRRRKTVVRIFSIEPDFDGMTDTAGRLSFEASAARDVNL